jgi:hypothetical protein
MELQKKVLVFGGEKDFNIIRLIKHCFSQDIPAEIVLIGKTGVPSARYDFQNNDLLIDNKKIIASSAFIRYDVFEYLESNDDNDQVIASNWHELLTGWLLANPHIKIFNRNFSKKSEANKFKTLLIAKSLDIKIAETHITNNYEFLQTLPQSQEYIYKPLQGGAYTEIFDRAELDKFNVRLYDYPLIVQEKLIMPELRVFRIDDKCFGFLVNSDYLDYRLDKNAKLELVELKPAMQEQVIKLTDELGLNFSALDFKTCPKTGEFLLLEANSSPMFAGFDQVADGKLIKAMLDYLAS